MQVFGLKYASELQVLTFDFTNALTNGNTLAGAPTVTVTCVKGNDLYPSKILNGAAQINVAAIPQPNAPAIAIGCAVLQPVKGGLPGAEYVIEVNCSTAIETIAPTCAGRLPIGCP